MQTKTLVPNTYFTNSNSNKQIKCPKCTNDPHTLQKKRKTKATKQEANHNLYCEEKMLYKTMTCPILLLEKGITGIA